MNWYKRQLKIAMPAKIEFSEDDLQAMGDLLGEGYSIPQVSEALGVSYRTIYRLDKKHKLRENAIKNMDKRISDLYLLPPEGQGLHAKEIKKKLRVGYNRVREALERLGKMDQWRDRRTMWNDKLREDQSERVNTQWKEKYPGGWDQFINQFPPEKQREIERAMNAQAPLPTIASTNWYKRQLRIMEI